MSYVLTDDGLEIFYQENGGGAPVVFVPGYFGVSDIWESQFNALADNYRTVRYDSRGYGRSAKPVAPEAYSIPRHAEDLRCLLDALQIDTPVVLVAHSIGSNIASTFAVKYPERVAGLVYMGAYVDGRQMRDAGMGVDMVTEAVSTPSGAVAFFRPFRVPEAIGAEAAKWPAHALQANARAFLTHDMAEQYVNIRVPALILQGDQDVPTPVQPFATGLQNALSDARLEVLTGVNHFPSLEAPDLVTLFLREHLQRCYSGVT